MGAPIWTKLGSLTQNNMQITANLSRSKSVVEFQYGGRLYFETGSSYISVFFFSVTRLGRTVAPILTLNGSNDVFPPKEVPFGGS